VWLDITESLPGELPSLLGNVRTLQAREVGDLAFGVKNIATAFIGDQVSYLLRWRVRIDDIRAGRRGEEDGEDGDG
jgi:hypothetical protein